MRLESLRLPCGCDKGLRKTRPTGRGPVAGLRQGGDRAATTRR
ncbi:hypothetical protein HMPREF1979_02277 [Actinomyces johnsonii F0542]|uniref:Uncharacterized protein n=1 Tax=Actinomyces johnsonii F0542 TaxID=1321818 RepID=U1Q440_9ACTO|nr:hypothetical protein HMPREF1979_02277 [Actinomyces johnsonii F0542]